MTEDRERAAHAGFDGYLEKPISVRAAGDPGGGLPRPAVDVSEAPVTVLAVDDQPPNLRLLDAVLAPRGYRVHTATSGRGGPGRRSTSTTSTWSCSTS